MVYCVCSLESPHRGDSNDSTQYTFMLQTIKEILIKSPDLALLSTLIGSNYPCLELICMVPKVFEPLKFDCICYFDFRSNVLPSISLIDNRKENVLLGFRKSESSLHGLRRISRRLLHSLF